MFGLIYKETDDATSVESTARSVRAIFVYRIRRNPSHGSRKPVSAQHDGHPSQRSIMESVTQRLFRKMPDGTKPLLSQGYHILNPKASWRKYRRRERTREHVASRFFDDWETFKGLEHEFFEETGIVDIVMAALEEVGDSKVVFDTHRGVCARVYSLIRTRKPDRVIATGVYSGVATSSILLALNENDHGMLYSIDNSARRSERLSKSETDGGTETQGGRLRDPFEFYKRGRPSCSEARSHALPPGKEPGWIVPDRLRDRWELREGSCNDLLPELVTELDDVRLFYQDSIHSTSGMMFEFELAWDVLGPDGLLISPHVDRNDAFDIFVEERGCEHGLLEYDYLAYSEYDEPCSCAYAIKPK